MRRYITFLLCSLILLGSCNTQQDGKKMGKVVKIADGDTFTLLYAGNEQVRVRLYGIDSPERSQPFGSAARKFLGDLLQGHEVYVLEKDRDRYGRLVGIAFRDDDLNLNEAMLQKGYAWHYRQYDKNPEWSALEEAARKENRGLWSEPNPTPPWEFRKEKRTPKKESKSKKQKATPAFQ